VEGVFKAAHLPLVRVPVKVGYAPAEIDVLLAPHLQPTPVAATPLLPSKQDAMPKAPAAPTRAEPSKTGPPCPKCGATMLLRTAKNGANAGGQFWGCPNFPRCRSMMPFSPSSTT
jgi:hypothetical protein